MEPFFKQAGELGCGEGYSRLAKEYGRQRNWEQCKVYYEKAAKLGNPIALHSLAVEAQLGYFDFGPALVQQSNRKASDGRKAFELMQRSAKAGFAPAVATR